MNWYEGYGNRPVLELVVDDFPDSHDLRFENRDHLYYAELDGYVEHFSWRGPKNCGGYGGSPFPIKMEDGRDVVLLGPWSSNHMAMNRAGFGPCMNVHFTKRNGMSYGAVTVTLVRKYARRIDIGVGFHKRKYDGTVLESFEFPHGSQFSLYSTGREERPWDLELPILSGGPEDPSLTHTYYEPAVVLPDGRLWRKP